MDDVAPSLLTLTVLISVRNGAGFIAEQLEALAQQDFGGTWEVVVVDNGSRDGTVTVVEGFAGRLPELRIVDASARPGKGYALNEGVRVARGRSVVYLDADDVIEAGYLAAMAAALEKDSFVAARLDGESLNPPWLWRSRRLSQAEGIGPSLGFLPTAAGCSLGIWRTVVEEVGGFDDTIGVGSDFDYCWRVQLRGHALVFVPDAVVGYRYRDTLWGIFVQARAYGAAVPALYRRYRAFGMPASPGGRLRRYVSPLVRLVRARSRSDLAVCAYQLGIRVGGVVGCLKNRVFYL